MRSRRMTAARISPRIPVDRELDAGESLTLSGETEITLEVLHTPGHAPGHLCFLEPSSGAMIVGDMVAGVGTILVEPGDGDMQLYLESLRLMSRRSPRLLLPAHGPVLSDPGRVIDHYIRHRLAREARVMDALHSRGAPAAVRDLVPLAYADVAPAVWPLAERSTQAHLLKLEREGRAQVSDGLWSAV